jgi:hypothetical protein
LVANGKSTTAIFDAALSTNATSGDTTFTINAPTAAAGWHGSATRPQGNMLVTLNSVTYPVLSATANGAGWDVTISRPNPSLRSDNLGLDGDVTTPATAEFFLRSQIASSGHTMEYVGSGTNYTALPENGGVPDDTKQIVESNGGKVWTAITDQNGKFKIGDFFEVDQRSGFVTLSAGSYAFDVVTDTTPQLGGQLDALSNKIVNLADPTAAQDAATKAYVDSLPSEVVDDTTPQLGGNLDVNDYSITNALGNIVLDSTTGTSGTINLDGPIDSTSNADIVINGSGVNQLVIDRIITAPVNTDVRIIPQGTGEVNVADHRIMNVIDPIANQDAATKAYVDSVASAGDAAFIETPQTQTTDKVIAANTNAACVGPIAVDSGVTITIGSNSKLVVLN